MVDKAVRLIKRDLDIETILDRLQEIEKFKKLLLTQDELNLFEYTLKPVIKWNDFS